MSIRRLRFLRVSSLRCLRPGYGDDPQAPVQIELIGRGQAATRQCAHRSASAAASPIACSADRGTCAASAAASAARPCAGTGCVRRAARALRPHPGRRPGCAPWSGRDQRVAEQLVEPGPHLLGHRQRLALLDPGDHFQQVGTVDLVDGQRLPSEGNTSFSKMRGDLLQLLCRPS